MGREVDKNIEIMKLNSLFIFGLVAIIMSCGSEKLKLDLFSVEEKNIGYQYLLDQDFKKSEVDAMMFEKSFNDTLIYYEYTGDLKNLYSKIWEFSYNGLSVMELEEVLNENNIYLMVPDHISLIASGSMFCVKNYSNNLLYFCSIKEVDGESIISVIYYFPF